MSTLLHGFLLSIFGATYLFTIWFSWNKNRSIIWDYLYLTHWNLTFQVFFLIIELLSDFSSTFDEMTIIFRSKFLHSILIPFSLCVSIVFWVICIFYNENVLRGPPAERWPEWHNHISHTIILPAIVIECIINDHRLPIGYHSLMITIVMGATYILWVTFFGVVFGKYSYELIETASATKTIFFFLLLMIFLIIANHIGRWMHIIYWRKRRTTLMQKNK
uniref:Androgen-induced gene 1 protein-like n=1 Tax=Dermatophagoides pteronyssinus TaxID=6956 RepID=A0A6P6YKE7_DERPT|nr:androgen-induced gene 1 protein-like [Dermatophagoides pteronyssinus]